ncbi:FAD-binding oxidoreductase [Candidatus Rariloculus sp.]|uniref:FAD-binding oxidoreductase n=1 Tax=Candidatus Rariloculus sp. TaxID=3101265 RepID=UPI003D126D47
MTTTTAIVTELEQALGPGRVLTGDAIGAKHHVDFSGEHACAPWAVVRPDSTEELATVMKRCHAAGQHVVIQGGMTGLAGGATPQPGELAVSMERMSGIEEIDSASMTATVLAATPLQTLQEAAAAAGFLFPLDLGARGSCTIGGNIATNAGGNQVIRFGMMRNLVLGLEAVLADGTVVSSMNRMLKNNAGYDLKQLFIGTEGTLGIVTRAVLRLYPKLPSKTAALCALGGFAEAVQLLQALQARLAGSLSAFEAMWESYFHCVVDNVEGTRSPFDERHPMYVLIETEGTDEAADRERLEAALEFALDEGIIVDAAVAHSERERESFWAIRDGIAEITPLLQPMLAFDVSMPIGQMPSFLARVDREFAAGFDRVQNHVFGHIGDNNLHLAVTTGREADIRRLSDIVYTATGAHQGSVSAEHGIGTLRRGYLHHSRTREEIELMRRLKTALDPKGILNPNRVVPD